MGDANIDDHEHALLFHASAEILVKATGSTSRDDGFERLRASPTLQQYAHPRFDPHCIRRKHLDFDFKAAGVGDLQQQCEACTTASFSLMDLEDTAAHGRAHRYDLG